MIARRTDAASTLFAGTFTARGATLFALWLYVFCIPLDVVPLPAVGTVTRLVGLLAIATGLLTTLASGRMRKPDAILLAAAAFAAVCAASLIWTISYDDSVVRVWTYLQLLGSLWLIQEFADTPRKQQALLAAFCLGVFVPMVDQFLTFRDIGASTSVERFTSAGILRLNANDLGLTMVLGIPIAWYFVRIRTGWLRLIAIVYLFAAPAGILLTASRGSFIAGVIAFALTPMLLFRWTFRSLVSVTVVITVVIASSVYLVPDGVWERLQTIPETLVGGGDRMSGRVDIWDAGLRLVPEHPALGIGAGAYASAMDAALGRANPAHNVLLDVLVEEGFVGLALFLLLIIVSVAKIWRLQRPQRALWTVMAMCWFVGAMSVSWGAHKTTWLFLGLLAADLDTARARIWARHPRPLRHAANLPPTWVHQNRAAN